MKIKNVFIIIFIACLFPASIFAETFQEIRTNVANSLKHKVGDDPRLCNYNNMIESGKPRDIENIKKCMESRKIKDARYYVDKYEIMYKLISKNNNEGLEILLKDSSWNPATIIRSFGNVATGVCILDTPTCFVQIAAHDQYIQSHVVTYRNLPLISVAAVFENTKTMELLYKYTATDLQERSLLYSIDDLIKNDSQHFDTLYKFAKGKTADDSLTIFATIKAIEYNNKKILKKMIDMYPAEKSKVNFFEDVVFEYYNNEYKKGLDSTVIYDVIKQDIGSDSKNEILYFLINNHILNKKLITSVLDSLTLEDIRDGFASNVLLDSVTQSNVASIDNLTYFIINHSIRHSGNLRVTWGDSTISLFAYWAYKYSSNDIYLPIAKTLYAMGSSVEEIIVINGEPRTVKSLLSQDTLKKIGY